MEEGLARISSDFNELTILILVASLVFVVLHQLLIYKKTRILRSDNLSLREKEEASRQAYLQRDLFRSRTKSMEDSLKYAQRIQKAIFIPPGQMGEYFPESFIFQKPKDIVSGDFYWAGKVNGRVVFSVADCTGHGVPGAFLSLLGLEFFRQIVVEREILRPATILNEMNIYFDRVFENTGDLSMKDGIDLGLCSYDYRSRLLEFAGAFNPLYIVRNNEIMEVKGDRIIVGPDYGLDRRSFTNHSIPMEEDDVIYMFSDGFADQFGGPEGKKYKYRRFRHLLMSIHELPMKDQQLRLEASMKDWMGLTEEQIDDQMVIGIRPASFSFS